MISRASIYQGIFKRLAPTLLASLLLASPAMALTEVRGIPTRPGVTLDFLYMTPEGKSAPPRSALIMFPGGNGLLPFRLLDNGAVHGWNFLVRSAADISSQGLTLVTVNAPSDHASGMGTGFRESSEHAADISILCSYLVSQGIERIFLIGNSRGTLSAAALAALMTDQHIKGIILTSSLEYDNFMRWLPLDKIRLPVLMVHNSEDSCRVSQIAAARKTAEILRAHTTVDFVEIAGGADPMSPPCDNLSSHGFFGVEAKVVRVIVDWINGRKVPERIE